MATSDAILHIEHQAGSVKFTWDSADPAWTAIKTLITEAAFLHRPVYFITGYPPFWDLELNELKLPIRLTQEANPWAIASTPAVSADTLHIAVESTDFELSTLKIATFPLEDTRRLDRFLAFLNVSNTPEANTAEEWMECWDDIWLHWYNPRSEAVQHCIARLHELARVQQWQIEIMRSS